MSKPTRQRPAIFKALGNREVPHHIQVDGEEYHHVRTIKHDSWAATALYRRADGAKHVVCKFNRLQPIGLIPMSWLGRWLAQREFDMYERLSDLDQVPRGYRFVLDNGQRLSHACAHDYVEGHPLRWHDLVDKAFFDQLEWLLRQMHARNIAYVDMNKSENVIVDRQGRPCLIDFQISVCLTWPGTGWILRILQHCDLYHCGKLERLFRRDCTAEDIENRFPQPWWIGLHRKFANPFRAFRRRLLVLLGIRNGKGKPHTEQFIEEALRADSDSNQNRECAPIIELYRVLQSDRYRQRFQGDAQVAAKQLVADLFHGAPDEVPRDELVGRIVGLSEHHQVIELLKSKVFYQMSAQWDDAWLRDRAQLIRESIERGSGDRNVQHQSAA